MDVIEEIMGRRKEERIMEASNEVEDGRFDNWLDNNKERIEKEFIMNSKEEFNMFAKEMYEGEQ